MYPDPLWFYITYMCGRVRQRVRAARAGQPESGALTLEWLVIAFVIVTVALAALAFFRSKVKTYENKIP
jgi:heme/copper-type cytochrome/quinol oxidase subunit 2